MKRRNALKTIGGISTHILFPSILAGFLASCKSQTIKDKTLFFFTQDEMDWVIKIIDLIIPETNSTSASKTGTHFFLDEIFAKCLSNEEQIEIRNGLQGLISSIEKHETPEKYLKEIDHDAYSEDSDQSWFITFKKYTMIGFFTSFEGMTKASNYVAVPGEYIGDMDADENTLNHGLTSLRY